MFQLDGFAPGLNHNKRSYVPSAHPVCHFCHCQVRGYESDLQLVFSLRGDGFFALESRRIGMADNLILRSRHQQIKLGLFHTSYDSPRHHRISDFSSNMMQTPSIVLAAAHPDPAGAMLLPLARGGL